MKRALRLTLLLCLAAGLSFAEGAEGAESSLTMWKWANFVVLAAGLGYLAVKALPPIFNSRSQAILKDLSESEKIRQDAEARVTAVERRLAGLETEIATLRSDSARESKEETARMAAHGAAEIAKVQTQAEQEITAAGKAARMELKRHAAELAVALAEQKIRGRMTPATQDGLVQTFVRELK